MDIAKTIKQRRQALNYTQEQVADRLGVSTPAVNKWERGASYPDITLLLPLARILGIDLNELLGFEENLSDQEIAVWGNRIAEEMQTEGYEAAFAKAQEQIQKYPRSDKLIFLLATVLDGGLTMNGFLENAETYRTQIESWYERVAGGEDSGTANSAKERLIHIYIERKAFEQAQRLVDELPDALPVDKKMVQANLYNRQGKEEEGARMVQERLFNQANQLQNTLSYLLENLLAQGHDEAAEEVAIIIKEYVGLLKLFPYSACVGDFVIGMKRKDAARTLAALRSMQGALKQGWKMNAVPLYDRIQTREIDDEYFDWIFQDILKGLIEDDSGESDFLKKDEVFLQLINR